MNNKDVKIIVQQESKNALQARVTRSPTKGAYHILWLKTKYREKKLRPIWVLGTPYEICFPPGGIQIRYGPPWGAAWIPRYATVLFPVFIVFRKTSNTTPGLAPTRLNSRDMYNGTWYIDPASSVGMIPSC